jgi:hypothetical protein
MSVLPTIRIVHHNGYRRWMRYCIGIASVAFVLLFLLPSDVANNSFAPAQFHNGFNTPSVPAAIAFADWQDHEAALLLLDPSSFIVSRLLARSQPLPGLLSSFHRYHLLYTGPSSAAPNLSNWPQAFNRLAQLTPILLC